MSVHIWPHSSPSWEPSATVSAGWSVAYVGCVITVGGPEPSTPLTGVDVVAEALTVATSFGASR